MLNPRQLSIERRQNCMNSRNSHDPGNILSHTNHKSTYLHDLRDPRNPRNPHNLADLFSCAVKTDFFVLYLD